LASHFIENPNVIRDTLAQLIGADALPYKGLIA
jgi:hypothetical protein